MCLHDFVTEAGVEEMTYWCGDTYCCAQFDLVECHDCGDTFALDDLHGLG
jgi:hypothetical protein